LPLKLCSGIMLTCAQFQFCVMSSRVGSTGLHTTAKSALNGISKVSNDIQLKFPAP
jgi:hypothetical protein